ncbi:hypothetical protein ACROYT_G021882 [Oculina patagonica]
MAVVHKPSGKLHICIDLQPLNAALKERKKKEGRKKEALSVLYGLKRFDQYTHGRPVKVENDRKPLAAILRKPLNQAPKRLQDIMMQYHRYDVNFVFVKGTDLLIADTLSRAHPDDSDSGNDQGERARIKNVNVFGDIPGKRLDEIREAISCDASLQTVMKLVLEGWPADKRGTPVCALPYFDVRDCLSVVDGILVKGEAVVIPMALRRSIKRRLHSAHLGCESMLRRARGTVYWPNMASDMKQIADMCETCQQMKPQNLREPLKQHSDGDEPWQKIGLDLFEIAGKHYLAVVDYYFNFIEIDLLTTMTSTRVVTLLKKPTPPCVSQCPRLKKSAPSQVKEEKLLSETSVPISKKKDGEDDGGTKEIHKWQDSAAMYLVLETKSEQLAHCGRQVGKDVPNIAVEEQDVKLATSLLVSGAEVNRP